MLFQISFGCWYLYICACATRCRGKTKWQAASCLLLITLPLCLQQQTKKKKNWMNLEATPLSEKPWAWPLRAVSLKQQAVAKQSGKGQVSGQSALAFLWLSIVVINYTCIYHQLASLLIWIQLCLICRSWQSGKVIDWQDTACHFVIPL